MQFIGECALCKSMAPLMNSHIIPEFLYRSLYDHKGRASLLSTIPGHKNRFVQNGIKERLLCAACETRLSAWERYASLALNGGIPLDVRHEGNGVFVSGIDYLPFRLFLLSIIWRAGVSKHIFFEKVKLGQHTEILRKMLIDGNAGSPSRYGCFMFGLKFSGSALTQLVAQPVSTKAFGQRAYKFVFGGFAWVFLVSSQEASEAWAEALLHPGGRLFFLVKNASDMTDLRDTTILLERMGRLPRLSQ